MVKERADLAVRRGGVEFLSNGWSIPEDIMNCGLAYLVYDWIHDALDLQERERWGGALGSWLHYFTGKPEILLKWGHWEYNQTWAPST